MDIKSKADEARSLIRNGDIHGALTTLCSAISGQDKFWRRSLDLTDGLYGAEAWKAVANPDAMVALLLLGVPNDMVVLSSLNKTLEKIVEPQQHASKVLLENCIKTLYEDLEEWQVNDLITQTVMIHLHLSSSGQTVDRNTMEFEITLDWCHLVAIYSQARENRSQDKIRELYPLLGGAFAKATRLYAWRSHGIQGDDALTNEVVCDETCDIMRSEIPYEVCRLSTMGGVA